MRHAADQIDFETTEERIRLAADRDDVDFDALSLPLADFARAACGTGSSSGRRRGRDRSTRRCSRRASSASRSFQERMTGIREFALAIWPITCFIARAYGREDSSGPAPCGFSMPRPSPARASPCGCSYAFDFGSDFSCACQVFDPCRFSCRRSARKRESGAFALSGDEDQSRWIPAFARNDEQTAYQLPVFLNSSMPFFNVASMSLFQSDLSFAAFTQSA